MNEIFFDVDPMGKPRMTRQDKWIRRDRVVRYRSFSNILKMLSIEKRFQVPADFEIDFYLPIGKSVSKSKRTEMINTPHNKVPDIDNLLKAFLDALCEEDKFVHSVKVRKFWSERGCIAVRWK